MIIWGTRIKRRRLGRAADFCPICRELRAHRIRRIGLVTHVYYLSIGAGSLVAHEAECEACGATREVDGDQFEAISRRRGAGLDELITETYPGLRDEYAQRLAIEERVASNELTPEERDFFGKGIEGIESSQGKKYAD